MVSAWAQQNQLVLGQQKVDAESNEITAIPKLLTQLDIAGAVVTIDVMGCQRKIAEQIIDQGADYVLSLKGNQGELHEDVHRKRMGYSAANMAIIRHIALNLLKAEKSLKRGIKTKRLKAGWDKSYLLKVLLGQENQVPDS